jgi:Protein of unknown function (DUF2752)
VQLIFIASISEIIIVTINVSNEINEKKKPISWHFATALINDVRLGRGMLIGGMIYGIFSYFGITLMQCPFKAVTGLPCPGCGMTRSTLALLQGNIVQSIKYNALTGILLVFWLVVAIGVSIPKTHREKMIRLLGKWEQTTRWPLWFGIIVIIYTLTRWARFC